MKAPVFTLSFRAAGREDWVEVIPWREAVPLVLESSSWLLAPTPFALPNGESVTLAMTCDPSNRGCLIELSQDDEQLAFFSGYLREGSSPNPSFVARTLGGAAVNVFLMEF